MAKEKLKFLCGFLLVHLVGCTQDDEAPKYERLNTDYVKQTTALPDAKKVTQAERLEPLTFAKIKERGLPNAVYPDVEHYLAEYLFQNPSACYWKVDEERKIVSTVKIPTPTGDEDEINLPKPSGLDDTDAIERIINSNPGKTFVGQGVYKIGGLSIKVPAKIFNMPMVPANNAGVIVQIKSENVRIYHSPIDAQEQASVHTGFRLEPGSHHFHLVKSGFSNAYHRKNQSGAGVFIRGSSNFRIACNAFNNFINETSQPEEFTARANAIWVSGAKKYKSEGGYIVNNVASNFQSNGIGGGKVDAEFFTTQAHTGHGESIRIFANRCVNAGKRFTKWQNGGGKALSNYYHWKDRQGPLGPRTQRAIAAVHFGHSDVSVNNNRIKIEGNGEFTHIFNMTSRDGTRHNNVHFDGNDIEISQSPTEPHYASLIVGRYIKVVNDNKIGLEATNSSAKNNRFYGAGSANFYYWFGPGWDDKGGNVDLSGNVFDVPADIREYK